MAHRGRLQVLLGFRCSRCSHFLLPFRSFALLSDLGAGGDSICEALIEGDAVVAEDSTGLLLLHGNLKRVEFGSVTTSAICELKKTSAKRQY